MQKIFVTLFFIIVFLKTNAQQHNAFTKDVMPISPEISIQDKIIRNPHAQTIVVNGITIDKRIGKYYQEGDFTEMPKEKLQKLNVIYLDSYVLVNTNHSLDSNCKENIKNNFDLGLFNHLRKTSERVTTPVFFNGCSFVITLFSWDEINNIK